MIFKPFPDNDITQEERVYIAEIQEKLRTLELAANGTSNIPVDGIYGPMTTAAVERFQKNNALTITGIMDRETYYALVEAYNRLLARQLTVRTIDGFSPADGTALRSGDSGDSVSFLNIMLRTLSSLFQNVPVPDTENLYDSSTEAAVRSLQTVFNLPPTGIVNRQTWNRITELYNDITVR